MRKNSEIDLERLVQGDRKTWHLFVEQYSAVIYAAVLRTFQNRCFRFDMPDVREVVQNVFLKLVKDDFRLLKTYDRNRSAMVTWLTIVTRSTAIDFLRALPAHDLSVEQDEIEMPVEPEMPDIGRVLPAGVLSARQTLVLHLLFNENMSTEEIAAFLEIETQTVRSCKHKAIKKLRDFFDIVDS